MIGAWIANHRRSILFAALALAVGGLLAAFSVPVTLFPQADFPRVVVSLDSGDRPAEQMEQLVTWPIEEVIGRVPGVRNVRSTTSRGSAEVSITFDWGTNMPMAAAQVNESVAQVLPSLPSGTVSNTRRMDPTVFPILAYSLVSDTLSGVELYNLARYQLRPLLQAEPGVARADVQGGSAEEYRILADPGRLATFGLAMADLSAAVTNSNSVVAVGRLEDHYKLYLILADGRLADLAALREVVVRATPAGVVHLRDVADVVSATAPTQSRVTADGHDAVLLQIYQQPGSNSVAIAAGVERRLAQFLPQLPKGVRIEHWYDQSELVIASAKSVRDAILIGIALSALVIWLFLRSVRVTLIALVVVPLVLSASVLFIFATGMSFNIMTLGGMAAAVGLVIDDAIVMIEHLVRRIREAGSAQHSRIMAAAAEFTRPLLGSSFATIIVFLPLAFLGGISGTFFKALAITITVALIISMLICWLAVPILAERWLRDADAIEHPAAPWRSRMQARYERILRALVEHPSRAMLAVLVMLAVGGLAFMRVGSGFMPEQDEGGFILDYRAAPGTSLTETDRLLRQLEAILQRDPDVRTYSRRTGLQLGGGITESNEGDFFVRLKPQPRAAIDEVMDRVRKQIEAQVPGLEIELLQLLEDVIGDLTAVPQPIEVKLFGDDAQLLASNAAKIAEIIGKVAGVVDVNDGVKPAGDALSIHFDSARAAVEGVDVTTVSQTLSTLLASETLGRMQQGTRSITIRLWTPKSMRATEQQIGALLLRAADGHRFPLSRIADVTTLTGQPQITREGFKRMIPVTARITGRDLGSTVADVQQLLTDPKLLPPGMYYELGGLYAQQQIAFRGLTIVFAAAIALVFVLLLYLFESFRVTLSVMLLPLLAASAVFVGLWLTGISLNITAIMGMTMIVGIVTEVAIFYFVEYQHLLQSMTSHDALVAAGVSRMRPILMTTMAAILTLLPLAFAIGEGSEMQQPLAVSIIAGLIVQVPLVLFVMPAAYALLLNRSAAIKVNRP